MRAFAALPPQESPHRGCRLGCGPAVGATNGSVSDLRVLLQVLWLSKIGGAELGREWRTVSDVSFVWLPPKLLGRAVSISAMFEIATQESRLCDRSRCFTDPARISFSARASACLQDANSHVSVSKGNVHRGGRHQQSGKGEEAEGAPVVKVVVRQHKLLDARVGRQSNQQQAEEARACEAVRQVHVPRRLQQQAVQAALEPDHLRLRL